MSSDECSFDEELHFNPKLLAKSTINLSLLQQKQPQQKSQQKKSKVKLTNASAVLKTQNLKPTNLKSKKKLRQLRKFRKEKPSFTQQKKMKRKSSKQPIKIGDEVTQILIRLFNLSPPLSSLHIALRTGLSTARVEKAKQEYLQTGVITSAMENKQKSPYQHQTERAEEAIRELVAETPCYKVSHFKEKLLEKGFELPAFKIGDILHAQGYEYRRLDQRIILKNTEQVIRQRYFEFYLRQGFSLKIKRVQDKNLYFIGETKFNLTNKEHFGWAKKEEQYKGEFPQNPGRKVIALIGFEGLMAYVVLDSEGWAILNSKDHIKRALTDKLSSADILVLQNPTSPEVSQLLRGIENRKFETREMPQFSPQLNPIKSFFSGIKSQFVKMRTAGSVKTLEDIRQKITTLFQGSFSKRVNCHEEYLKMRQFQNIALKKQVFDCYL